MSVRYVPNHKEFGELMMSDQIQGPVLQAANDIVEIARDQFSPRSNKPDVEHYVDQFGVKPTVVTINGTPRVAADAINTSDHAAQVEFGGGEGRPQGGSHGQPSRPLGRAGAIVGDYKGGPPA